MTFEVLSTRYEYSLNVYDADIIEEAENLDTCQKRLDHSLENIHDVSEAWFDDGELTFTLEYRGETTALRSQIEECIKSHIEYCIDLIVDEHIRKFN